MKTKNECRKCGVRFTALRRETICPECKKWEVLGRTKRGDK